MHSEMSPVHVVARGDGETRAHGNCRRQIEEELRGTVNAEASQRRVKEYQDKAAVRGTKQTNSSSLEGQKDAPTATTTIQSRLAPL